MAKKSQLSLLNLFTHPARKSLAGLELLRKILNRLGYSAKVFALVLFCIDLSYLPEDIFPRLVT